MSPQWITLKRYQAIDRIQKSKILWSTNREIDQALSKFLDAALLHSRQVCALSQTKMILLKDCRSYSEELLENIQYWILWSLTSSSHSSSSMRSWRYLGGQRAQVVLQGTQAGRWSTRSLAFYLMTTMLVCSNSASCKPPCSHTILQSRYLCFSAAWCLHFKQNTHASCVWDVTLLSRYTFLMSATWNFAQALFDSIVYFWVTCQKF